jgi:hypothetical protein
MKRLAAALLLSCSLTGCVTAPTPSCPAGQEWVKTAQLFLGRRTEGAVAVTDADLRRFVDRQITPRFPDGLTVLDGGRQWQGAENTLIREAAKVVLIVLPAKGDAVSRIEAVRGAYKTQFHQDTAMLVTQAACVSL